MKLLRKKEHLPQPRDDGLKNCYFCLSLQQPLLIHHPGDFRAVFSLPLSGSIIPLSVTPAIFKPGSTVHSL